MLYAHTLLLMEQTPMPVTRRKRANPPDQPENNTNHVADPAENTPEGLPTEPPADSPTAPEETENAVDTSAAPAHQDNASSALSLPSGQTFMPPPALSPSTNGDRGERAERSDYPPIEGGRRTARGEYFRRPPQPPTVQPVAAPPLQAPSHEIKLPLGKEPAIPSAIRCTLHIIPAILVPKRPGALCSRNWLPRARLAGAHAAGIVAPWLLCMIAGIRAVRRSVRSVWRSVRSVACGV